MALHALAAFAHSRSRTVFRKKIINTLKNWISSDVSHVAMDQMMVNVNSNNNNRN